MAELTSEEIYLANQVATNSIKSSLTGVALGKKNEDSESLASLTRILTEYSDILDILRREFRGEEYVQLADGREVLVQLTKPVFIKIDPVTREALRRPNPYVQTNDGGVKLEYIPNDDAIEELIATLRLGGINKITPITNLDENEIKVDLRSMMCKIAATLTLKQVEWGLDKELMPLKFEQIYTIVKDARMVAKNGQLLQALRSTIQRVEQHIEGVKNIPKPLYS